MFEFKHPKYYKELRTRNKTGVTATTKRDIGHSQELSFGFPPPVNQEELKRASAQANNSKWEGGPASCQAGNEPTSAQAQLVRKPKRAR